MKTKIIIPLLLLFLAHASTAQFKVPRQKDCIEVKKRTLLVRLDSISEEQFKKMYKKDQKGIDNHRALINGYNAIVREMVTKYWKENTDIQFLKNDEIKALLKKDEDKYAVFKRRPAERTQHDIHDRVYDVAEFGLFLGDKDKPLFSVAYPDEDVSETDMHFMVHQFNKFIEAGVKDLSDKDSSIYNVDKNLAILKSKTLYLPKGDLKIEESEIKESYPYAYKVATGDEIEKAVEAGDNTVVYPSLVWSERKDGYMYILVDAATLDVLSVAGLGGVFVGIYGGNSTNPNPNIPDKEVRKPLFSIHTGAGIGNGQLKYWVKSGAMKFNY